MSPRQEALVAMVRELRALPEIVLPETVANSWLREYEDLAASSNIRDWRRRLVLCARLQEWGVLR